MRKSLWCILVLLVVVACSDRPKMVVDDDTMVDLLVDIHRGDAYLASGSASFVTDSAKKVLRQSILKKHGVTQEQFDSSLNWYGHNIDHYVKLYAEVEKKLEVHLENARLRAESSGEMIAAKSDDASNLWRGAPIKRISKIEDTHFISFELDSAAGIVAGDRVHWQFRKSNVTSDMQMFIGVEYDDSCTSYITRAFTQTTTTCKLTLQTDTCKTLKRIYGYAHFFPEDKEIIFIDSIRVEKMPFVESNYSQILSQRNFDPMQKLREKKAQSEQADSIDEPSAIDEPQMPDDEMRCEPVGAPASSLRMMSTGTNPR